MEISNSGVVVTGGASGLGEATARALHGRGAHVLIADLNQERGEALAAELGEGAAFRRADVTVEAEVAAAVDAAAEMAPAGLRMSIHCAGIGVVEKVAGRRGPAQLDPFQRVIGVNLIGTFNALRLAAARMLGNAPNADGERGVCVNTASVAAFDGQMGQIAYAASKAGVAGMTLPAARDLAAGGIRINTIAPGLFDTPMMSILPQEAQDALAAQVPFPHRLGRPAEYAMLACHLVENPMLNGEVVRLDGALRLSPR